MAVVGYGANAMQIVPAVAPQVARLTVLQRSPHWIAPSQDHIGEVPPSVHFLMAHVPYYRAWYRFQLGWIFNYVVRLLTAMRERGLAVVECRQEVSDAYNARLDEAHAAMVWTHPGVSNYYRNDKGRVVTNSPWRFIEYWQMTRSPDLSDFHTEPRRPDR